MKIPSIYSPDNRAKRNFYQLGGGQLHALRLYLENMQSAMSNEVIALAKKHQKELKKYPQDQYGIDEAYRSHYYHFEKTYHHILMKSSYISALSLFEIIYKRICGFAASKFSKEAKLDFKDNIIINCNNYMRKELRIDLSDSDLLVNWTQLLMYREFRNKVVHHSSYIKGGQKSLLKFLKNKKGIRVIKNRKDEIYSATILNGSFIGEFLNIAEAYLIAVLLKLPSKKRGYKTKKLQLVAK